tara:strand:- start:1288 stop:1404 length:117 start_codon:yes stop_codon:yes gene_type:complete
MEDYEDFDFDYDPEFEEITLGSFGGVDDTEVDIPGDED